MVFNYTIFSNVTYDPSRDYFASDGYVPGAHMKETYKGTVISDDVMAGLEKLFYIFNCNHPKDFKGHSLSVGDVVAMIDTQGITTNYACASFGWTLLENFDPINKNAQWMER